MLRESEVPKDEAAARNEMPMNATAPKVRVAIPQELRSLCGGRAELCLFARDVRESLAQLARQLPQVHVRICDERGEPRPHINVFVNDQFCPRAELDTPLAAGDLVTILPAVSGG
jgi:molybdopterin converting factor small subunit